MTSTRKLRKQQARHDADARTWATDTAKALTLTLCQDTDPAVAPYDVGVVLDPGERPWVQVPARCSLDHPVPAAPGSSDLPQPAITPWLVTNQRLVGRFASGDLRGWRWDWAIGCLVDLTVGREYVHLDIYKDQKTAKIDWTGPGVAPLAVATVYHLHGLQALLDHPGLAPLRTGALATFRFPGAQPSTPSLSALDPPDARTATAAEIGSVPLRDERWGL
jgi:hypothetical protein